MKVHLLTLNFIYFLIPTFASANVLSGRGQIGVYEGKYEVIRSEPARLECSTDADGKSMANKFAEFPGCLIELNLIKPKYKIKLTGTTKRLEKKYQIYGKGADCRLKKGDRVDVKLNCKTSDMGVFATCKDGPKPEFTDSATLSSDEIMVGAGYNCSIEK